MKNTSWEQESVIGFYQEQVILPNLLRLVYPKAGEVILDIGAGEGYFAKAFAKSGAEVIGVEISKKLVERAKKTAGKNEKYFAGSADDLTFLKSGLADKAMIILAIQNFDNVHAVFAEAKRVLKPGGKLIIVMNHPAFRIPKHSSWEWDFKKKTQHRRIDEYLTESKARIEMRPSEPGNQTISFHRPLQFYFKLLGNNGFAVTRLEEWISPRTSAGPRAEAENKARREIPLFLYLECAKI